VEVKRVGRYGLFANSLSNFEDSAAKFVQNMVGKMRGGGDSENKSKSRVGNPLSGSGLMKMR